MGWTLATVVIRPGDEDDQGEINAKYALQSVIDSVSEVISFYAVESERKTLRFVIFENDNGGTGLSTLQAAAKTDSNVALVSDLGSQGNWRILNLSWRRKQDFANTLPVWRCEAHLIKAT